MKISIAMCTYNGGKFLGDQLQSICKQSKNPYELIICDDGSTDKTLALIEEFRHIAPFPIRLIRNVRNLGSTKNFEQAIGLCSGDLIALCDQDDEWMPNKLQRMSELMELEPELGGIFSDALLIDDSSRQLRYSLWQRGNFTVRQQRAFNRENAAFALLDRDIVTGATLVFRSSFVRSIVPIPEEWVHDGWIAMLISAHSSLRALPERLVKYRLHNSQQIGIPSIAWNHHLRTERTKAIHFHHFQTARWSRMATRLCDLTVDQAITSRLEERLAFLQQRTALLKLRRVERLLRATSIIPGYLKFAKGLASYVRDILHS